MKRVLVVEDEPFVRILAVEELTEAGYEVVSASSGDAALAVLADDRAFDVLFTDIRMPGETDGWALGRIAAGICPAIRIVYATGYAEHIMPLGGNERFLAKPYTIEDVLAAMN